MHWTAATHTHTYIHINWLTFQNTKPRPWPLRDWLTWRLFLKACGCMSEWECNCEAATHHPVCVFVIEEVAWCNEAVIRKMLNPAEERQGSLTSTHTLQIKGMDPCHCVVWTPPLKWQNDKHGWHYKSGIRIQIQMYSLGAFHAVGNTRGFKIIKSKCLLK